MVVQKEILYALLGHTGQVIVATEDGFELAKGLPLVDASERALLSRLLALGSSYRELEAFVGAQLFGEGEGGVRDKPTAQSGGPYLLALALGLEECLQPYRARVLSLEQSLLRTPDLSLPALQLGFGDFELTLPALRRLLAAIQHSDIRGVALLDHLHASAAGCVHSLRASLRVLLRHTQRVLRSQLAAWLLHGELLPGDGDFFIERSTRRRDAEEAEEGSVAASISCASTITSRASASYGAGGDDAPDGTSDVLGGGWFAYDIAVARKPAFLPMRVAERILFIGKAVRVLRASEVQRESGQATRQEQPTPAFDRGGDRDAATLASPAARAAFPRAAGGAPLGGSASAGVDVARAAVAEAEGSLEAASLALETAAVRELAAERSARKVLASLATPRGEAALAEAREGFGGLDLSEAAAAESSVSAAVEMRRSLHSFGDELRALPVADGSLMLQPLERLLDSMHRTASRLLWRHLTQECGLLELLTAIQSYLLLGRGNVFHTLVEELRPLTAAHPPPLLDLNAMLHIATSGEPPDPHLQSARLRLAPTDPEASVYDKWRSLTLELEVEWPLDLLVHAQARARYAELFRFLLLVKRVQMELHAAWNTQTQSIHLPAEQRALLMPLWRLRAHMAFLIDNLQSYLHADVLDVQWHALMSAAQTCDDFEALTAAHESCLSALHAQCFLQASSVSSALHQIFQLCLALCRMLAYAEAGSRSAATYRSQFATVSREFSRQSAFLFAFLSNMSSPQQSPHLAQLLLRLNYNEFFKKMA